MLWCTMPTKKIERGASIKKDIAIVQNTQSPKNKTIKKELPKSKSKLFADQIDEEMEGMFNYQSKMVYSKK